MLHDLASAAAEWLADGKQLASPAPPRKPEAAAADGGSGEALQHVKEVSSLVRSILPNREFQAAYGLFVYHFGTCQTSANTAARGNIN